MRASLQLPDWLIERAERSVPACEAELREARHPVREILVHEGCARAAGAVGDGARVRQHVAASHVVVIELASTRASFDAVFSVGGGDFVSRDATAAVSDALSWTFVSAIAAWDARLLSALVAVDAARLEDREAGRRNVVPYFEHLLLLAHGRDEESARAYAEQLEDPTLFLDSDPAEEPNWRALVALVERDGNALAEAVEALLHGAEATLRYVDRTLPFVPGSDFPVDTVGALPFALYRLAQQRGLAPPPPSLWGRDLRPFWS